MTTTATKQTAENNAVIARVEGEMNLAIAREFARLWTERGERAARAYLGGFFSDAARKRRVASFFDPA